MADRHRLPLFFGGGHGGQYAVIVPGLDLVAVTLADATAMPFPKGGLLRHLVTETMAPAFETAT